MFFGLSTFQMALMVHVTTWVLQFIGHAIEGNDAGELILIKKLLGKPYQEFRPGYVPSSHSDDPQAT